MTTISNNVYFDVVDDIVDEYNNIYHKTIKMKPANEEANEEDPKYKVGDHVRISNFKNVFAKGLHLIGVKKGLVLKK